MARRKSASLIERCQWESPWTAGSHTDHERRELLVQTEHVQKEETVPPFYQPGDPLLLGQPRRSAYAGFPDQAPISGDSEETVKRIMGKRELVPAASPLSHLAGRPLTYSGSASVPRPSTEVPPYAVPFPSALAPHR